jgi:hypothetical protein
MLGKNSQNGHDELHPTLNTGKLPGISMENKPKKISPPPTLCAV